MTKSMSCVHHEAVEIKIASNKKRIHRIEKGFFWIFGLLVANLGSVIAILAIQLVRNLPQ